MAAIREMSRRGSQEQVCHGVEKMAAGHDKQEELLEEMVLEEEDQESDASCLQLVA